MELQIDLETLQDFRWTFICDFTFMPQAKIADALRRIKRLIKQVQIAENRKITYIALAQANGRKGPVVHVAIAGIKGSFRKHVLKFNRSQTAHCHISYAQTQSGIRIGASTVEHPAIATFQSALLNPKSVEIELFGGALWDPQEEPAMPTVALLTWRRRVRRANQVKTAKANATRARKKSYL